MESIIATTVVLLCFFPGFLILKIVEAMTDTRRRTDLDKIVVAVGYSVWIYFLYLVISHCSRLPELPVQYVRTPTPAIDINFVSLALITALTILTGFVIGKFYNAELLQRINVRSWITPHLLGGQTSVWNVALDKYRDRWIAVYMRNGEVLRGAVQWYSDDPEHPELFLGRGGEQCDIPVTLIGEEGEEEPVPGPGVLITRETPIQFIAFLDSEERAE